MTRFARRTAIVSALVAGWFAVVFFVFVNHNHNLVACPGCGLPRPVLVAKVSIPKGTSGRVIGTKGLYSTKYVQWSQIVKDAVVDPSEVRGEVTIRTIPAGARLTAADFALRSPIYYPTGYPRVVSGAQTPRRMVHYLGPRRWPHDLEVASGVWVREWPLQSTIDEFVANGTLVGFCGSVRAFQAHNPEISFAT